MPAVEGDGVEGHGLGSEASHVHVVLHRGRVEELDDDSVVLPENDVLEALIRELHHENAPNRRLAVLRQDVLCLGANPRRVGDNGPHHAHIVVLGHCLLRRTSAAFGEKDEGENTSLIEQ